MCEIFELKSERSGCLCVVNTSPLLLASHQHVQIDKSVRVYENGGGKRNYDYTVRKLELALKNCLLPVLVTLTWEIPIFSATMCLKLKAHPHDLRHLLSGEVNIGLAGNTAKTENRGGFQDDVAGSD